MEPEKQKGMENNRKGKYRNESKSKCKYVNVQYIKTIKIISCGF